MRYKVSIIGAGNVGAEAARYLLYKDLADIVLIDIVEGVARGKALDLAQASQIIGFSGKIKGSNNYEDIADSDVVIITAGVPRKPGMSRDDLIEVNFKIIKDISEKIKIYAKNSIVIVVTNPLDAMTYAAYKILGFERERVIGQAGVLDSSRLAYFVSQKLNVLPYEVQGLVLGTHGDDMVPLVRYTTVNGISITKLLSESDIDEIVNKTKYAGGEIVQIMGTSAFFAPGDAAGYMAEIIIKDIKKLISASVYTKGEYKLNDVVIGLPIVLGKNGIEKIVELDLDEREMELLNNCAKHIKELQLVVDRFLS
ncbi:MAG: malate dehydrogenase [candidate division WOR-3 bacterium]|nr:malate dehydrogenase [candidate division WOR-3 bacterium]